MARKKLKLVAANLGLASGGVVVALLVAELLLRLIPASAVERNVPVLTTYDSILGWRKIADTSATFATSEYRIVEATNSQGIRGPEYPLAKPDGEYRILLLGDSFAEGYTVDFDSLCSEVLKRALNARADGRRYVVINTGTAGYSTDQELLYFETLGRKYHPDLTVLLFYVNDVWFNTQGRYWRGFKPWFELNGDSLELRNVPVPPPDRSVYAFEIPGGSGLVRFLRRADGWLATHSRLHALAREGVRNSVLLSGLSIKLGLGAVPNEFRAWERSPDADLATAWDVTDALLRRLDASARDAGSSLLIVHVPSRPAVYPDDWKRTRRKYALPDDEWSAAQDATVLNQLCERSNLDCLFLLDRFRARASESAGSDSRLYFEHDAHWTPAGHRAAGEAMADYIARTYLDERRPPQER